MRKWDTWLTFFFSNSHLSYAYFLIQWSLYVIVLIILLDSNFTGIQPFTLIHSSAVHVTLPVLYVFLNMHFTISYSDTVFSSFLAASLLFEKITNNQICWSFCFLADLFTTTAKKKPKASYRVSCINTLQLHTNEGSPHVAGAEPKITHDVILNCGPTKKNPKKTKRMEPHAHKITRKCVHIYSDPYSIRNITANHNIWKPPKQRSSALNHANVRTCTHTHTQRQLPRLYNSFLVSASNLLLSPWQPF